MFTIKEYQKARDKILSLAKSQKEGIEYRYNCFLCGDTRKRLYIRKEVNKVYAHCFNGGCKLNHKGLVIPLSFSLENIHNYLSNNTKMFVNTNNKTKKYQVNLIENIPQKYVKHLLKYLPKNIIEKYNNKEIFLYDYKRDRLAVKCFGGYVLRSLEQKPKWLNLGAEYFVSGKEFYKENNNIVLTEDVISAVKASESLKLTSLALLGTHLRGRLKTALREALMDSQRHIYIWLDKDKAGILGAINLKKQLEVFGNVHIVYAEEPKLLSFSEIQDIFYNNKNV